MNKLWTNWQKTDSFLMVVVVVFFGWLIISLIPGNDHTSLGNKTSQNRPDQQQTTLLSSADLNRYHKLAQQFPLYETIEPIKVKPTTKAKVRSEKLPTLKGIIRSGTTVLALLETENGDHHQATVGDKINQWQVTNIDHGIVEIRRQDKVYALNLSSESVQKQETGTSKSPRKSIKQAVPQQAKSKKIANDNPKVRKFGNYYYEDVDD